jgi:hypothetical protein
MIKRYDEDEVKRSSEGLRQEKNGFPLNSTGCPSRNI